MWQSLSVTVMALLMTSACTDRSDAEPGLDADAFGEVDATGADATGADVTGADVTGADVGSSEEVIVDALSDGADRGVDAAGDVPGDGGAPACPPPAPGSIEAELAWGQVLQHRMGSGVIVSIPIVSSPIGRSAVIFTQGQQPSTPAGVVTELTVSRCRGVIDSTVPQCHQRTTFVNNNQIAAYARAVNGWLDQATLGAQGCWAPESAGPWYVNVRWTYDTCPFASCGFSFQWTDGAW